MKLQRVAMLLSLSSPLIASGAATAEFLGIQVRVEPNSFGLGVYRVYAVFDRPGQDEMLAVAGLPKEPLTVEMSGGTFYQNNFGGDLAPLDNLVEIAPSLAFDTFITIGVKSVGPPDGQPADHTTLTPSWPGFGVNTLHLTNDAWAVTPGTPQGDPFDAVNCFPGDGRVLIGQFSTANAVVPLGTMLLQYRTNGITEQRTVGFAADFVSCDDHSDCRGVSPCAADVFCKKGLCLDFAPPTPDCNDNGWRDSCDIAEGTSDDCNDNAVPDECDVADGTSPDCNGNGVPDECDIVNGTSGDLDGNGVPDECEPCPWDLDGNGSVDTVDFLDLIGQWGTDPDGPPDFDDNGTVDTMDLLELLANWGQCP